jgi:hypothetical protein
LGRIHSRRSATPPHVVIRLIHWSPKFPLLLSGPSSLLMMQTPRLLLLPFITSHLALRPQSIEDTTSRLLSARGIGMYIVARPNTTLFSWTLCGIIVGEESNVEGPVARCCCHRSGSAMSAHVRDSMKHLKLYICKEGGSLFGPCVLHFLLRIQI